MKKLREWICKHLGHKYNEIQLLMMKIEMEAVNSGELKPSLDCQRCGKKLFVRDLVKRLRK